jgi:integrase
MGKLTALRIKSAGPGRHPDGDGLYLIVRDTGSRQWLLRIQAEGKRRDLGLGAADTSTRSIEGAEAAERIPLLERRSLTLAEAREKADAYRRMVRAGLDPAVERQKAAVAVPTFEKAARDCHAELKSGWRNKRHSDSWLACLVTYAFPTIGAKPVDAVDSIMVRDLLSPIWIDKAETARRVLQRVGAVLDFSHIKGWRPTETSLKSVRKGLPRQRRDESHFEAMAYEDVPAFIASLRAALPTVGREALEFTILTAVRSNETRFAVWSEIDLKKKIWTIPGARMKMNQTHIVPLAPAAVDILRRRWEGRTKNDGLVFFAKPDKAISDMTMTKILRDAEIDKITVHGFRSSFTDWAAETTKVPKEVVDKALAHKLPDKVEAAYRRTDFLERRRQLMTMWANYLAGDSRVVRLAATA